MAQLGPDSMLMSKSDEYRATLRSLDRWDEFLLRNSGLPGPRGNIELAQVVADEGTERLFNRYLTYNAAKAPTNSPYEFLAFCGVVGCGRLLAEGKTKELEVLRRSASDPRWRIREGVAMALQRLGEKDMNSLLRAMEIWSEGNLLEQRAAAAALCEPRLLRDPEQLRLVLKILDKITVSIQERQDRKGDGFQALRKGLGYCWSVAVAALPGEGQRTMEKWFSSTDKDILWIMRENLKKNRLARVDAKWVAASRRRLSV
jgi:hypothetical protein